MDIHAELAKLERTIKDGEIRLKTVRINIELLNKEIDILTQLEGQLIDNIRFLKKNKIIATASEYKRSKEDLAKTVIKLVSLKNDREHFKKATAEVEKSINKAQKEIEKLKNKEDNVLRGNFKRKNNE